MELNIENISSELKQMVSIYSTDKFLGGMTSCIAVPKFALSQGLFSPLREILYLCNLHLSSKCPMSHEEKPMFSQEEWEEMISKVNQIQKWYMEHISNTQIENEQNIDYRIISYQSFLNYFNQGPLNYVEQVLERIDRYFSPFSEYIEITTGSSLNTFIEITRFLMEVPNRFFTEYINPKPGEFTFREFVNEMQNKKILPSDWGNHMTERIKMQTRFRDDAGILNTFSRDELIKLFGNDNTNNYLKLFTVKRNESDYLFYSQKNQMLNASIYERKDGDYQFFKRKLLPLNLYNSLNEILASDNSNREEYFKVRGKELEKKIAKIFNNYFGEELEYFKSYYTEKGMEQDLIFFHNNTCLIVEVKSSKVKEPRRDPIKAFELIKTNFDEVIDKGYEQTFRVKEYFLDKQDFKIYDDSKMQKILKEVKVKKYHHHFSIIVTLERFGGIQCDLSQMLEIYGGDSYPWSVTIDDLESFLLILKKETKLNSKLNLVDFLYIRQRMHGKIFTDDESDILGAYLKGKLNLSTKFRHKKIFPPGDMDIFDEHYQRRGGIGFENEIGIEMKKSKDTIIFG